MLEGCKVGSFELYLQSFFRSQYKEGASNIMVTYDKLNCSC